MIGPRLPSDGLVYAAVSLEKLRAFGPALAAFREQVVYRFSRKSDPSDEDQESAEPATQLCEWIDQVREAESDLWYCSA